MQFIVNLFLDNLTGKGGGKYRMHSERKHTKSGFRNGKGSYFDLRSWDSVVRVAQLKQK
jgi:hypothetical protein